ncbi:unnamed protein product [Calicophoron daubneyi]|uniref:Steroid dehydrogenase n=1 Tax=Calicophoron daubneyi TaxID=300641 RepID=A0AAV2TFN3_CALDB
MFPYLFSSICVLLLWKTIIPPILIIYQYTLGRYLYGKRRQLRAAGEWAIITGGTDGIGKAFAEELASDGLNIMIISRTMEKLKATAHELKLSYGVSVKTVQADFTQMDIYERIQSEVDALSSIACLVNNVGMVNLNPESLAWDKGMQTDNINRYIICNTISAAAMSKIVLPRLIKQNSGGAIINLSSISACVCPPYLAIYASTKAFVKHLSASLSLESIGKNVTIQAVCPAYVATAMVAGHRGFWVVSPRNCASSVLNQLGVEPVTYGHILHALEAFFSSLLPQYVTNDMMEDKLRRAKLRIIQRKKAVS